MLEAERHYERARLGRRATWLSFYTEAELAADLGRCLRDAGEPEQATHLIKRAMDAYDRGGAVNRCFVQTDLATAHLVGRDFEHVAALGRDAVRAAARVSSSRTLDRLRTLQRPLLGAWAEVRRKFVKSAVAIPAQYWKQLLDLAGEDRVGLEQQAVDGLKRFRPIDEESRSAVHCAERAEDGTSKRTRAARAGIRATGQIFQPR